MIKYLFAGLFTLFYWMAFSQDVQMLSLEECIQLAWENNISLQQTKLNTDLSQLDIKQSKAARYPNLSASSNINFSGRSVDPTNNELVASTFYSNGYSLSSNVPLYQGGVLRYNIERAQLGLDASELQLEDLRLNIGLQTAMAYLNVLFAKENIRIAESRLANTEEQVKQIQKLIESGSRPANELAEREATLASDEQNLISAQGNMTISKLNLRQIMRLPSNESFDLAVPDILINSLDDPFSISVEEIYQVAVERQPIVKNAEVQIKISAMDEKIAKSALQPSLFAGGSLGSNYSSLGKKIVGYNSVIQEQDIIFNGSTTTIGFPAEIPQLADQTYLEQLDQNVTYGYGLNLSIPIYNNSRNRISIDRAKIANENARLNQQQVQNDLYQSIQQALTDAQLAKKAFDASEKSVRAFQASLANVEKRFEFGSGTSYELSLAKSQYDNAVNQALISKYDFVFKMKIIDFYLGKPLIF